VSWDRDKVSAALGDLFASALPTVKIHTIPPLTLNPPCVVISDADVAYNTASFCADTATVPVIVVGGMEATDAVEDMKNALRAALDGSPDLGGVVSYANAVEERNWRYAAVAGVQLLTVELMVEVKT
jgi:hypothetical protein